MNHSEFKRCVERRQHGTGSGLYLQAYEAGWDDALDAVARACAEDDKSGIFKGIVTMSLLMKLKEKT